LGNWGNRHLDEGTPKPEAEARVSPGSHAAEVTREMAMENHDRQQVAEVYTISQVTDLTGVPENTIRSWERRFGLPEPDRTAGKQRRYTRSDVNLIRAIQASRDAGRTMEQAIADATSGSRGRTHSPLTVVPTT